MSEHVYKKVELIGSSQNSIEGAVENALERADDSIRNTRWVEVSEIRGHVEEGRLKHWQVGVKLGFTLDSSDDSPAPNVDKKLKEQGEEDVKKALGGDALNNAVKS